MKFYFRQGIFTHHPDFQTEDDITAEAAGPHLIMGSPQQCIEQLERYHEEFGVDYFTIRFRMPTGPSLEAAHEQIQRFGEEVVQPIHEKYPAPDHPAIPWPAAGRRGPRCPARNVRTPRSARSRAPSPSARRPAAPR